MSFILTWRKLSIKYPTNDKLAKHRFQLDNLKIILLSLEDIFVPKKTVPNSVRQQKPVWMIVVCGNRNFVSVLKKLNQISFVKPCFTVNRVLYKTDFVRFPVHADAVSDDNHYQTYVPSFSSFRS